MAEKAGINFDSIKRLFGISDIKEPRKIKTDVSRISLYSPIEANQLIKGSYVKQQVNKPLSKEDLITYLNPVYEKISRFKLNSEMMRALAPEINKAGTLLPAIIMSPNDLQDGIIQFELDLEDNVIPSGIQTEITKLLSDYFNNTLNLGTRETQWLDDIFFTSGAKPILIIPNNKIQKIIEDSVKDKPRDYNIDNKPRVTFESFRDIEYSKINKMELTNILFDDSLKMSGLESFVIKGKDEQTSIVDNDLKILFKDLHEEFQNQFHAENVYSTENIKFDSSKFEKGLEEATVKLIAKLGDGDAIHITDNPMFIRAGHDIVKDNKKINRDKMDAYFNQNVNYKMDRVLLIPFDDEPTEDEGHPLFLELPTESVIPICVPGNKAEHIGYFILLDEYGYPLEASEELLKGQCCSPGMVTGAYNALFGSGSNCMGSCGLRGNVNHLISSRIFETILDKYLTKKVQSIGYGSVEVGKMNSIAACMFHRLLFQKKTTVLFVPDHLLTYMAFDYRKDGTGHGKLEDVEFILSLKNTYMVASIISMMNSAVPTTRFNVTFPEEDANPELLMDSIKNTFIENNRIKFSVNPVDITKNIYNNSITIAPTNFPGADNLSIEKTTEDSSPRIITDNDLLEKFDTLFIDSLDIPHSVFNKLGDEEFAKSVVTNNLFLAKKATNYQRILKVHNNKLTQTYVKYSYPLKKQIIKILGKLGQNAPDDTGTAIDVDSLLLKVISSIRTNLPSPNIVVDKAKYTEIKDYVESVTDILNGIFSEELLPEDSTKAKSAQVIKRAYVKRKMIKDFLETIGMTSAMEIPEDEDIDQLELQSLYQHAINLVEGIKKVKDQIEPPEDNGFGGGFGDTSTDGGDMGMGDDISMDMGMGDTSLDNPDDMNLDEPIDDIPEPEPTTEQTQTEETDSAQNEFGNNDFNF